MSTPLKSPQQEKFAQCLAQGMTQAAAYRVAYPRSNNWKDEVVYVQSSTLAADSKVIVRVSELQAPAMRAMEMSIERILKENAYLAFSDVRKLFDENGLMLPVKQWPDDIAAAVASIEVNEIGGGDNPIIVVKKIKFWDKGAALDKLFKNFGMYQKDNEQKSASLEKLLTEIADIGRKSILGGRKPITIDAE